MSECLFCTIKEHSAEKILYEDKTCLVTFDKFPIERGHLLVMPKAHSDSVLTAPDDTVAHLFVVAKRFAVLCKDKLNATGISMITNSGRDAGQIVPHTHIHIIPKYSKASYPSGFVSRSEITPEEIAKLRKMLSTP